MAKTQLVSMLGDFAKHRKLKETYETLIAAEKECLQAMQPKLVLLFENEKLQSMAIKNVGMFYLDARTFPRVENEKQLFAWLRQHKMQSLIKSTIHHQTLRGLVNERMSENKSLPKGVTTYDETVVVMRTNKEKGGSK